MHRSHTGRLWRRTDDSGIWFLSRRSTWHQVTGNPLWSDLTVPTALQTLERKDP